MTASTQIKLIKFKDFFFIYCNKTKLMWVSIVFCFFFRLIFVLPFRTVELMAMMMTLIQFSIEYWLENANIQWFILLPIRLDVLSKCTLWYHLFGFVCAEVDQMSLLFKIQFVKWSRETSIFVKKSFLSPNFDQCH